MDRVIEFLSNFLSVCESVCVYAYRDIKIIKSVRIWGKPIWHNTKEEIHRERKGTLQFSPYVILSDWHTLLAEHIHGFIGD